MISDYSIEIIEDALQNSRDSLEGSNKNLSNLLNSVKEQMMWISKIETRIAELEKDLNTAKGIS